MGILLGVAAAGLLATLLLTTAASAQDVAAGAGPQAMVGQVGAVVPRTAADMQAFDAAHPNPPTEMPPFLPTMDFGEYRLLKAAANARAGRLESKSVEAPAVNQATPPAQGPVKCKSTYGLTQLTR